MEIEQFVSFRDVSKAYKKSEVLSHVSLDIHKGEIFGLLGPSGAGKTTMIRLLMGIEAPTSGKVEVMGSPVPNPNVIQEIGYMAQSDALYIDLSAEENMKMYCEIFRIPKVDWHERIETALKVVNLDNEGKKIVSSYSGGMKRRLSLAIAILHRPKLLVLDEPTVGMDPVLRQNIWNELKRIQAEDGVTVLITTHVMDEAEKCDRLAMIREGKCISVGAPDFLLEDTGCKNLEEVFLKLGGALDEN